MIEMTYHRYELYIKQLQQKNFFLQKVHCEKEEVENTKY